jgi:phosphoenolpyruvate carboxykinase (GTP)
VRPQDKSVFTLPPQSAQFYAKPFSAENRLCFLGLFVCGEMGQIMTNNSFLNKWIEEMKNLTNPDNVVLIDGSESQLDALRKQSVDSGELLKLNEQKLPGCYLHRTAVNDVARVEHRTFICSRKEEDAGPTNNWMNPKDAYSKLGKLFKGSMHGRTMYVIPYSMGAVGSPFSKIGIELTDSVYVVLNMNIMTRIGQKVLDTLGDSNDFVRGLHSKAELDEENRFICHFPEDNTIWSVNSGYGGNVLLGKKCFALRIASYLGKQEGWFAEHMLILGIENPQGEVKYICAAFPSACGKTNLAMLIPPEIYGKKGYKVWCVGDDIAWLRIGPDGRLWAVNPENGFFGVAPGTNEKSNPNALASTRRDTIFTNVAYDVDNNTVWWEGLDKNPPKNAITWKGEKWDPASGEKIAHPNSRFTAPALGCPCLSSEFESPKGVPISAIVFGGRRAKTAPLVYQSLNWEHGVFVGSTMASETTAAASGKVGVVRRDPMAMLPFCGYHMADYFEHWLTMGKKIANPPKIFNVNWFRTDDDGRFIWPGFGDNMRVLMWILDRCDGKAEAVETPIGYEPNPEDIETDGLSIDTDTVKDLLEIDPALWREEVVGIKEFYAKFGEKLPKALTAQLNALEQRLN